MNAIEDLANNLEPLGLADWRFFPTVGSTNDVALNWAREGAADWSLVVSDAQTKGRGRGERRWITKSGQALAFSLVFRLKNSEIAYLPRVTALAALGVIEALGNLGLQARLKWPNDVLLKGAKVGGVLVEADWQDDILLSVVIGVGVNVFPASVPPDEVLRYPAIDITSVLGKKIDRWALLAQILKAMQSYRKILSEDAFITHWNQNLVWREQWVKFQLPGEQPQAMRIIGVLPDGRLALETCKGLRVESLTGEIIVEDFSARKS